MDASVSLAEFRPATPLPLLAQQPDRLRALQARLAHHGLLDPPPDAYLGPVTTWALREFCTRAGTAFENSLSPATSAALAGPQPILPLRPGDDLAGRVVRALFARGDWICRHPDCLNIVYLEGTEPDGARSPARLDAFDDTRLLIRVGPDGRPEVEGAWAATTGSGSAALEDPVDALGPPRLEPGQHKGWVIGRTAIGTDQEQDALVQAAPLAVTRDVGLDGRREGDPRLFRQFIVDQHGAFDAPRDAVGDKSAGCLVGQSQTGHETFMRLLRTDARWRANNAYRLMTSVLTRAEFAG